MLQIGNSQVRIILIRLFWCKFSFNVEFIVNKKNYFYFFDTKIVLAQPNGGSNGFTHGQLISFGDGQQAIIVQNGEQGGAQG